MKLRHILALLLAWSMVRLIRLRSRWRRLRGRGDLWSRREAWDTCVCLMCGWAGPCRWVAHGYQGCGDDEVEASYECPSCGDQVDLLTEKFCE